MKEKTHPSEKWRRRLHHAEAWGLYGILCIMIKTESYGTCWADHEQLWRPTTNTRLYMMDGMNQ